MKRWWSFLGWVFSAVSWRSPSCEGHSEWKANFSLICFSFPYYNWIWTYHSKIIRRLRNCLRTYTSAWIHQCPFFKPATRSLREIPNFETLPAMNRRWLDWQQNSDAVLHFVPRLFVWLLPYSNYGNSPAWELWFSDYHRVHFTQSGWEELLCYIRVVIRVAIRVVLNFLCMEKVARLPNFQGEWG